MKSKYLVRPECPEDWVDSTKTASEVSVCLLPPVGNHDMLEVRDGIYFQGKGEPYHQHDIGSEIFYLAQGQVRVTVRGKCCDVDAGDMVFIPTGVPHGLHFPDNKTVWRVFLEGMNVYQRRLSRNTIAAHYPEKWDDPEFVSLFARRTGAFPREPSVFTRVDKSEIPEVRSPEFGWSVFTLPGGVLRQVVGRWETRGLYEVWRAELEPGCEIHWDEPHPDWELYQVTEGQIRFHILEEEFMAGPGNLVRIPPYTTHRIRVESNSAVVYDMGSQIRLLSLLEDYISLKTYQPEKLEDATYYKRFLRKHNCFVTYFGVQPPADE